MLNNVLFFVRFMDSINSQHIFGIFFISGWSYYNGVSIIELTMHECVLFLFRSPALRPSSGVVVQKVALLSDGSELPWVLHVLPVSLWVSTMFSSFLHLLKTQNQ